jgi:hypothetical protein
LFGTVTSISCCEESLSARCICAKCRADPRRAHWRQSNRRVASRAEYHLGKRCGIGTEAFQEDIEQFVAARQLSGPTASCFPLGSSVLELFKRPRAYMIDALSTLKYQQFFSIISVISCRCRVKWSLRPLHHSFRLILTMCLIDRLSTQPSGGHWFACAPRQSDFLGDH